ncbi:MAG: hypothetical protein JWR26_3144, partial [Pedosphaera sp.]|nr:hypothetical protein [Pedosphaera sp.]
VRGAHGPHLTETRLTGKPDAGNPPVRFGGRGEVNPSSLPLSLGRRGLGGGRRVGDFGLLWGFGGKALKAVGGIRLPAIWTGDGVMWRERGAWGVKKAPLKPRISRLPTLIAGCRRLPPLIFRCVFFWPGGAWCLHAATMGPGDEARRWRKGKRQGLSGCIWAYLALSRIFRVCFFVFADWSRCAKLRAARDTGHHWDGEAAMGIGGLVFRGLWARCLRTAIIPKVSAKRCVVVAHFGAEKLLLEPMGTL